VLDRAVLKYREVHEKFPVKNPVRSMKSRSISLVE